MTSGHDLRMNWCSLVALHPLGGGNGMRVVASHCDKIRKALHLDVALCYLVQSHNDLYLHNSRRSLRRSQFSMVSLILLNAFMALTATKDSARIDVVRFIRCRDIAVMGCSISYAKHMSMVINFTNIGPLFYLPPYYTTTLTMHR